MISKAMARSGVLAAGILLLAGCASSGLSMEDEGGFFLTPQEPVGRDDGKGAGILEETAMRDRPRPTVYRGNDRSVRLPATEEDRSEVAEWADGESVSLNFEDVPLRGLVQAILGDLLGVDYSIDKPIEGTATLQTGAPVERSQLIPILQSFLQANGALMVKGPDGIYHVGPAEAVRNVPRRLQGSENIQPGYTTVIVPLHYISASQMADILRPVAPDEAFVRVDGGRNLLMLAGTQYQLEGWLELVNSFDVDRLQGMSVGIFPLEHGSVEEVGAAVNTLLDGGGGEGDGGSLSGLITVMPLERLNSLLVVTPRAHYLDRVETWIERLDRAPDDNFRRTLYVYPVQNGTASQLADMLNQIFGGSGDGGGGVSRSGLQDAGVAPGMGTASISSSAGTGSGFGSSSGSGIGASRSSTQPSPGGSLDDRVKDDQRSGSDGTPASGSSVAAGQSGGMTGGVSGTTSGQSSTGSLGGQGGTGAAVSLLDGVRVVADDSNNSLLIYARRQDYEDIEDALRSLDVAPSQILIEASIIEVSLTGDLRYGLQWYLQGGLGGGYKGTGELNFGDGDIGPRRPGFSYTIANGAGQIRAVLNALAEKSLVQVISSPSLMVLDNHTATIQVGDQQPIRTGDTITSTGFVSSNINYKDTGVTLAVTPSANAGGLVRMEVQQTVTDVGQVDSATGQRSFLQREIQSQVAVRSGQTVVLGGLIKNNASQGKSGIPLLGDLPGVGNLFSTTSRTSDRTELLVMLTPRVLRDQQDLQQITDEMRDRMTNLRRLPGWNQRNKAEPETEPDAQDSTESIAKDSQPDEQAP